jgi:hypothetical protein
MLGLAVAAVGTAAYLTGAQQTVEPRLPAPQPPNAAGRRRFVEEAQGLAPQPHGTATHRFRPRNFDWSLQGPVSATGGQRHSLVENAELRQRNAGPSLRIPVRRDGENSGVGYRRVLGKDAAAKLKNMIADLWAKDPPFFGTGRGVDRVYRFEANRVPRMDPGITIIDRRLKHWNKEPNPFMG